jgi:hypothetical protein
MGANSGPFTQRDHFFYERRHDVITYLRVHAISGVMDFYDYSPSAAGMAYYNDLNTGGVAVDGNPVETVTPGAIVWEMITGTQGTLALSHRLSTNIPAFAYTSYYLDAATPTDTQCTGDSHAYGASGLWVDQPIPNTDPYLSGEYILTTQRIVFYEPPNQPPTLAAQRHEQAMNPLLTGVTVTGVTARTGTPRYDLGQNVPNPFSASTRIQFSTPPGQNASIRVYDATGRLVRTLYEQSGDEQPGFIVWDGRRSNGQRVASGVYFYRLESPTRTMTRKMIVLQ